MSLIPVQYKVVAIALAVAAAAAGVWGVLHHERTLGAATEVAKQATRDLATEKANRVESDRRVTTIQEKANAADTQASAARADAVAARTAGDRLRVRLAAAQRANSAIHPAAACASAPTGDTPSTVPWDVFERFRDAAGQYAAFADDLSVRLDACVGSYGALTPTP